MPAVNFWGILIKGPFTDLRKDDHRVQHIEKDWFFVAPRESIQVIWEGEFGVIDHRFLKNKAHREYLEVQLKTFCEENGIPYTIPHWRITCLREGEFTR